MSFVRAVCLRVLVLFLLGVLCGVPFSHARVTPQDAKLVDKVCKKTVNYGFCERALNSDPRTPRADLAGLAQIAIDLTEPQVRGTYNYIQFLLGGSKDPHLKYYLEVCLDLYSGGVDYISRASGYLREKQYSDLNLAATAVGEDADDCEDVFKTPPVVPSPLSNQNTIVSLLADIVLSAAYLLENA